MIALISSDTGFSLMYRARSPMNRMASEEEALPSTGMMTLIFILS